MGLGVLSRETRMFWFHMFRLALLGAPSEVPHRVSSAAYLSINQRVKTSVRTIWERSKTT